MWIDKLYEKNDLLFNKKKRNLRWKIFIKIFGKVLNYYEENLKNLNVIDFNDMINNSSKIIKNNEIQTPYKYIINPPKLTFEFETNWDVDDYRRENNLTTLKERIEKNLFNESY